MALLFLEAIGPEGERLALEAGRLTEIPVGFDSEFNTATSTRTSSTRPSSRGSYSTRSAGSTPTGACTCAWPISGAGGRAAS